MRLHSETESDMTVSALWHTTHTRDTAQFISESPHVSHTHGCEIDTVTSRACVGVAVAETARAHAHMTPRRRVERDARGVAGPPKSASLDVNVSLSAETSSPPNRHDE